MAESFGSILERNRGIGPGFDFARVLLSLSVLAGHSAEVTLAKNFDPAHANVIWIAHDNILPMFFGLSGFLVAGSAMRQSLPNFALNRGFRIFPALVVEIFLSALLLGPLLTSVPLNEYFKSPELYRYFRNIIGDIHFTLPGMFPNNPWPDVVNASLWTIPFELACYILLAFLMITGLIRNMFAVIVAIVLCIGVAWGSQILLNAAAAGHSFPHLVLWIAGAITKGNLGAMLVPSFLTGTIFFRFKNLVKYDFRLLAACLFVLSAVGVFCSPTAWTFYPIAMLFCIMAIYVILFIGMSKIPLPSIYARGDYSYGIYLYGFPIQQSIILFLPFLVAYWPLHFAISVLCATAFAAVSWHFIEKPILSLRKGMVSRFDKKFVPIAEVTKGLSSKEESLLDRT